VSDYFTNFVNRIYDELDEPYDYSKARISGWFLDSSNLGQLNNLIGTCYTPTGYYNDSGRLTGFGVTPTIKGNELGVYKLLFDYNYYFRLSRLTATSLMTVGQDWVSMQEGDSKITRINYNEVSKNLRGLAKDAKETLDKAVKMYLKYGAIPQQIAGDDTIGISNYLATSEDRGIINDNFLY
jgi:hypothetical protein